MTNFLASSVASVHLIFKSKKIKIDATGYTYRTPEWWRSFIREGNVGLNLVSVQCLLIVFSPNVCAVQEVFRTGEKFSPDCVKKRLKKVCGRPT